MDLGLDTVRVIGRPRTKVTAVVIRELTPTDMALLALDRGVKAPALKSIRDSHHAIARCVAEGKNGVETQLITGYSASRISILKADPAFQQLVAFYAERVGEIKDKAFIDTQAKLAALGSDAIDELADRLNDSPEKIDTDELVDIVKLSADRTGHGPQTKSTNVNVNVDLAQRIAQGRERVARLSSRPPETPVVIEGEMVDRTPPSPPLVPEGK